MQLGARVVRGLVSRPCGGAPLQVGGLLKPQQRLAWPLRTLAASRKARPTPLPQLPFLTPCRRC
jgi:hypothetical protein